MATATRPKLVTFDGEARSGKGTIVHATKDYLRDTKGYKVMLIDAGQVFRVLVVAATEAGVDLDSPVAIDAFLSDDTQAERCVRFVKEVYGMPKDVRDDMLYTSEVGVGSAKVGARPLSQSFKDMLLKKWLRDAGKEGYEIVLLDGRALEETGTMLEAEGLCDFVLGLYFTSDPIVGARRTLGFATTPYNQLGAAEKHDVDKLVTQIRQRNHADRDRAVQPILPPRNAAHYKLPDAPEKLPLAKRTMLIFDTSNEMTKSQMTRPVTRLIVRVLTTLS